MYLIGLQYLGKKNPCRIHNKAVGGEVAFGKDPVWLQAKHAQWLLDHNPAMFRKVGEKGDDIEPVEDAADIIAAKAAKDDEGVEDRPVEGFPCPFCDKVCKTAAGLKRHVSQMHPNDDGSEPEGDEQ